MNTATHEAWMKEQPGQKGSVPYFSRAGIHKSLGLKEMSEVLNKQRLAEDCLCDWFSSSLPEGRASPEQTKLLISCKCHLRWFI